MPSATTCADSSAAAVAVSSGSDLLIAAFAWLTRNPLVKALTIAWSAPDSRPSSTSSTAPLDCRCRATIRAVAIHSHCAGPRAFAAAVMNCPASVALSGP